MCLLFVSCKGDKPLLEGEENPIDLTSANPMLDSGGLLKMFNTPAYIGQKDVADLPVEKREAFFEVWDDFVEAWTENSINVGLEPEYTNSLPADYYFNPKNVAMDNPPIVVPARWNAFPYRIYFYYQSQLDEIFRGQKIEVNGEEYSKSKYALYELADAGLNAFSKANQKFNQNTLPEGKQLCSGDTKYGKKRFDPLGPRGWLDEYCEFAAKRSSDGSELDWAMFTCENPEYYWSLWSVSPETVLKIYKETLDNSNIKLKDLYLTVDGKEVQLPDGSYAYNPVNKWNSGTVITENSGGAIHLTSSPNELAAEIVLAAGACIPRKSDTKNVAIANELICCSNYGRPYRNSDPHIGQSVYQAISKNPIAGTLLNPVGLYLQLPNFDVYELPQSVIDKGGKIEDCWQVLRGEVSNPYYPNNMILRAKFKVPDSWGIKTSEIKVASLPLLYASQISQTMEVQLVAASHEMPVVAPVQPCATEKDSPIPTADYVLYKNLYKASMAYGLDTLSNLSSNPITSYLDFENNDVLIAVSGLDKCKEMNFEFYDTKTGELTDMEFVITSVEKSDKPQRYTGLLFTGALFTPEGTPFGNKSIKISCKDDPAISTLVTPSFFRVAENKVLIN